MSTGWDALERRGRALAEEAGAVVGAGRCIDVDWLASAADWLSDGTPGWSAVTGEGAAHREYRCIVSSLHLEAWLICWPRGGRLRLHDHGGASGALRVVDGTLAEARLAGGHPPLRRRTLAAGTGIAFDGAYIHDVANPSGTPATSVHVYSAAERPMVHYRLTADGLVVPVAGADDAAVREDRPAASSRDLHPAGSRR